jgi:hypothetical protein
MMTNQTAGMLTNNTSRMTKIGLIEVPFLFNDASLSVFVLGILRQTLSGKRREGFPAMADKKVIRRLPSYFGEASVRWRGPDCMSDGFIALKWGTISVKSPVIKAKFFLA